MIDLTEMQVAYMQSGLDGALTLEMPDINCVYFEDTDEAYVIPDDETNEDILDRIKRSQEAGRNLFKEELELLEYEPGAVY